MIALDDAVFYPLGGTLKKQLIRQLKVSETAFVERLGQLCSKYNLESTIENNCMVWTDSKGAEQLILYFQISSLDLEGILSVYKKVQANPNVLHFILVNQAGYNYDLFRLDFRSYMQHCNHFEVQRNPVNLKDYAHLKRSSKLPFANLEPHEKYKWGKIFKNRETVQKELRKLCESFGWYQKEENEFVFWFNQDNKIQHMIALVYNPSYINSFINIYTKIKNQAVPSTYCIVQQIPDGHNEFDIFRLWELSYLQHYNRVRLKGLSLE